MKSVPGGQDSLTLEEKRELLEIARSTVEGMVKTGKVPKFKIDSPKMNEKRGVFVTLKKHHDLRGCIGYIEPIKPLYQAVVENAVNSSTQDWRFSPVDESELAGIEIEISVLTVPEKIKSKDEIVIGRHGVIMKKGFRSAVFLPQVAPEQGWNVEQTLENLSHKAGLPGDAWKEGADFYVFSADVFSESEFKK